MQKGIAKLEKTNQALLNEILEHKKEKHRLNRYNSVLEGINQIFASVVKAETEEDLGITCLSVALEITSSQIGFIGLVGDDGLLHDITINDIVREQRLVLKKTEHRCLADYSFLQRLYNHLINSGKSFFTNDLSSHPYSVDLPDGYLQLTSFLGVPLIYGGKMIGMLGVANREGDYSLEQQEDLEATAPAVMQILQRKREEKKKQKVEEALRESEEKYKALFENSLDAILFGFPEGTIYAANPAACQMFGMTEEEIIRSGRNGIIDTSDPRLTPALEERSRTGRFKGEFNYRRKDGTIFPGDMSSTIFKDKRGILRAVIIIRDITKRKQVEEALKHSEKQYRILGDTIPYGVWLTDAAGYCTFVSNSFLELVDMSMEQVQKFGWLHLLPPEDVQQTIDHWLYCIQTGENFEREHRFRAKDGNYRNVLAIGRPIKDKEGKITEWVGFNLNITERKQMENDLKKSRDNLEELVKERTAELEKAYNSLKESEEILADAQKVAHVGSYDWNIETNEEYWSNELYRIFGLEPQTELNHNKFLNYVHPEDLEYTGHAINEALNRKPYNIDYRIILPDGEERVIHSQGGVIFNEKNIPIRMRGIVQDVTEHKKAEENLARIEIIRKKEIHHRIKNNLQVISSLLDLQAEKFKNRQCVEDSEIIEAFRESQDRVISIALIHEELHEEEGTNDTLNFSIYLQRLVESLFQTYKFENTDISLNLNLEENVFFDMDAAVPLGIIVNELVSNSLKYAFLDRDKGEIQIKLCREEKDECKIEDCNTTFVLTVSDNGVGIPENIDIENFNSLGLQLVTSLVEQLDGEFELKRNKGTKLNIRFTVTEKNNQALTLQE